MSFSIPTRISKFVEHTNSFISIIKATNNKQATNKTHRRVTFNEEIQYSAPIFGLEKLLEREPKPYVKLPTPCFIPFKPENIDIDNVFAPRADSTSLASDQLKQRFSVFSEELSKLDMSPLQRGLAYVKGGLTLAGQWCSTTLDIEQYRNQYCYTKRSDKLRNPRAARVAYQCKVDEQRRQAGVTAANVFDFLAPSYRDTPISKPVRLPDHVVPPCLRGFK